MLFVGGLLDDKVIDALRLQRIGDRLRHEYRQHHGDSVGQCVRQLEHDDGQRDRRALWAVESALGSLKNREMMSSWQRQ